MQSFKKYTYISLGSALAAIMLYGGIFYHMYTIERSSSQLQEEVSALKDAAEQQYSLKNLENEVTDDVKMLESAIAGADDQVRAISFVEQLARENNTYISIVSVAEREAGAMNELDFKIVAEGSWGQIMTLLKKIQSMPLKTNIKQAQVEKVDAVQRYVPNARASIDMGTGDILPAVEIEQRVTGGPGWRLALDFYMLKQKQ